MNRGEIKDKLIEVCREIFQSTGEDMDLIEYVDFYDDLGMDSITFITLVVEIEACFKITIPDDMLLMDYFNNINSTIDIIEKTRNGENP